MNKCIPKKYEGDRIQRAVGRMAPNVHYVRIWNHELERYEIPSGGGCPFLAFRYEPVEGRAKPKRVAKAFDSLEDARRWQAGCQTDTVAAHVPQHTTEPKRGPLLREVVAEWMRRRVSTFEETTQASYESKIKNYLAPLFDMAIHDITPKWIDGWIDRLKERSADCPRRMSFRHELDILQAVLRYYDTYHDDPDFTFPVKKRHREAIQLNRTKQPKPKDMTEAEFWRFHAALKETKHGAVYGPLAVVQYFQALRINEAAAIRWEDISLNPVEPWKSRLRITHKVVCKNTHAI